MSIQLQGTGLIIKGKTVVNERGDINTCSLNTNEISVKSGGLKVNGSSSIKGDLVVEGNVVGDLFSFKSITMLSNYSDCLVELVSKVDDEKYNTFTGVFIRHNGWVVASLEGVVGSIDVWGTIRYPTKDKHIDVIKAHHVFVDKVTGLCVIKFPDIVDHQCLKWSNGCDVGEICYSMTAPVNPFNECSIIEGSICYEKFDYKNNDCTILNLNHGSIGDSVVDCGGGLITILGFEFHNKNLFGGVSSKFAKFSTDFMISNLRDYELQDRSCLGICKYSDVTHLQIITSGLLGIVAPKGIIIDEVAESIIDAGVTRCNPPLLSGNIVASIDDREIGLYSMNELILHESPGMTVDVNYIDPPCSDVKKVSIVLGDLDSIPCVSKNRFNDINTLIPRTIISQPYIDDFQKTNAINAKEIYDATHEKEIQYRKKRYLLDRLNRIKNRKGSKKRVKSRRKSRGR